MGERRRGRVTRDGEGITQDLPRGLDPTVRQTHEKIAPRVRIFLIAGIVSGIDLTKGRTCHGVGWRVGVGGRGDIVHRARTTFGETRGGIMADWRRFADYARQVLCEFGICATIDLVEGRVTRA